MNWQGKRYWLVGASDGLGLALAQALSAKGADLILSARNADPLNKAVAGLPRPAQAVPMDVADPASVTAAAAQIGAVDGVIFLAGVYWPLAAQKIIDTRAATHLADMCDINFTGCARVIGAVLPQMLARGTGHLVITGSLSGFRGLPGAMGYAASKAGCMVLAECLHADLRGSGLRVQLANPGFIRTRLTAKNTFSMPFLMSPDAAAAHMVRLMESNRFKSSFPRVFSYLFRAANFLPDWAYFRLFAPK